MSNMYNGFNPNPHLFDVNIPMGYQNYPGPVIILKDHGPKPIVFNMTEATRQNNNFRLAFWTGRHFQITLMSIPVGQDIGLELHQHVDQFLRIEEGQGLVQIGDRKDRLDCQIRVHDGYALVIPAGKWHNVLNIGCTPLKLYSIYAPPEHPQSTVHATKHEAEEHHG